MKLIKSIAFIKATGNAKFDKVLGQVRHILDSVFTFLIMFGFLAKLGIDISPDSWAFFLNGITQVAETVFLLVGSIGKLVVHASSWYSKDV